MLNKAIIRNKDGKGYSKNVNDKAFINKGSNNTYYCVTDSSFMKSEEEKLRQRQLMKEFQRKEKETFISGLPMEITGFLNLFDVLNEKLGIEECDHTLRFTEQFLSIHQLPLQEVVLWLNEYGGYCDCEVLFNIEEKFENL